ncbi:MAG: hypothetical protein H6739_18890 [Alphaproteobacteria bacterium]|nr:hypothetical protein [Alphaproteobacteria bacterium]
MRLTLLVLLACRCQEGASTAPPSGHYAGAEDLLEAALPGALEPLAPLAQGLAGDAADPDPAGQDARDRLHSALGFAMVAEDAEERADAVAGVAEACGQCHARTGVTAPALAAPPWGSGPEHAVAARRAWWGTVGADAAMRAEALGRLPESPPDLVAALTSCAGCHEDY